MSTAAKWVIVLTALLVLEVTGILATPALTQWYDTQFHIPGGEGWGQFGLVLWELLLIAATSLLMVICAIWWVVRTIGSKRKAVLVLERKGEAHD